MIVKQGEDLQSTLKILKIACDQELLESFQALHAKQGVDAAIKEKPELFVAFHLMRIKFILWQCSISTDQNFFYANVNQALDSLKSLFPKWQSKTVQNFWSKQLTDSNKTSLYSVQEAIFVSLYTEMMIQAVLTFDITTEMKRALFKKHKMLKLSDYDLWLNNFSFDQLLKKTNTFLKTIKSIYWRQPVQLSKEIETKEQKDLGDVKKGLILKQLWLDKILFGRKSWEVRSCHCSKQKNRKIALIFKNYVHGTCLIKESFVVTKKELKKHPQKHQIPDLGVITYKTIYVWVLTNVQAFNVPVEIERKPGQITWINVKKKKVKKTTIDD